MAATCGITIWFIDFDERLFQVFHFENITLSCYPLDILDLNKIEKYCLVLGALGECSWREFSEILDERRVKPDLCLLAYPRNFCAKSSPGDPSPVSASHGISWESTPCSEPLMLPLDDI